jgi:hypothetical protein
MEPGDILIAALDGGAFEVARVGGDLIGRTSSEQGAMVLACSESMQGQVWVVERSGRSVKVDCPVKSPMENFRQ